MGGYESKKLKIVVGMGSVGLFLLACLAYNLGGAKQQAKDVVIQENLLEAMRTTKNSLETCRLDLAKEDGVGPEFFRGQNLDMEVSLNHLLSNKDIEDERRSECTTNKQELSDTMQSEVNENYVLAGKKINEQIEELKYIIAHIRDEKVANRTSLRLKIRVFRQENKRLNAILDRKMLQEEEEEKRLDDIKHKNIEASREIGIGEKYEGDEREYTTKADQLVKSIAAIDDKQREEIYKKYADEDPEGDEAVGGGGLTEAQIARRQLNMERRQQREKQAAAREREENDKVAEQQRASIQSAKRAQQRNDDEEAPMPPRRRARLEAMKRARAEVEARRQEEEAAEVKRRRRLRRGDN